MTRYKLTIEYDGTGLYGWQRQEDLPSVQGHIENAVRSFTQQEKVTVQCSGRTDAGVHAMAQVAHVDITANRDPYSVMQGLNFYLQDHAIIILSAEPVADDFHARFHATKRHYIYRIINRRSRLALDETRAWQIAMPLDVDAMHNAAQNLVGVHDFSSFRASSCQSKSPIKTVDSLTVKAIETDFGPEIRIYASAQSFLHHQIRNFAGSLAYVGLGEWNADDLIEARDAKDRKRGGPTAPAQGLYFLRVDYPE